MNNAPTGLKPRVKTTRLSKLPLILGGVVILLLVIIMADGINKSKKDNKPVQEQVEIRPPEIDEASGLFGISELPEPPEVAVQPEPAPKPEPRQFTIRKPPRQSVETMKRHNAEMAQVRNWRLQSQLKALEAPMPIAEASVDAMLQTQAPSARHASAGSATQATYPLDAPAHRRSGEGSNGLSEQIASMADRMSEKDTQFDAQIDKEDFQNRARETEWTSPYLRTRGYQFSLMTGAVIPAVMITGIHSGLPGQITAQVSQHIWDTATGRNLLIPQGTRLLGQYDSRIVTGQERVLIAWQRLIFPDGSAMTLGSMPGADQAGQAGFHDEVDNHYWRIFGNALVMSLITGVAAFAVDTFTDSSSGSGDSPTVQSQLGSSLSQGLGQAGMSVLQRNLNIAPTLEIRPGYRFNVVIVKDLVFEKPYDGWR
jgi:type IV secretion system protein TrbI